VVPEQDREQSRNAENQRKSKEVPLLAEKIDIDVMKELHRFLAPYQSIPHCHPDRSEGSMHFARARDVHRFLAPLKMTSS
jgi:hypothetical protein